MSALVYEGSCLDVMQLLDDNSVDAIVTDPPYHLTSIVKRFGGKNAAPAKSRETGAFARASRGFMGQTWDGGDIAFRPETWEEALRVLKPGGHIAAFSGTRTYHRMAVAIEDAGFEIRDQLAWTYGSGFPKSHDVSKAIDKALGAEREKVRIEASSVRNPKATGGGKDGVEGATRPWIEEALRVGYHEKDGDAPATPQAAEWQGWGSALKPAWEPICLARKPLDGTIAENVLAHGVGALNIDGCRVEGEAGRPLVVSDRRSGNVVYGDGLQGSKAVAGGTDLGRWPANILHDGKAGFGEQGRFFYCAKASKADRGEGNNHPTVKPTELMRWLCRLITPPGGLVLDPFTGSGSTGRGAVLEGFRFVGIELSADYAAIARRRIAAVQPAPVTLEDMLA